MQTDINHVYKGNDSAYLACKSSTQGQPRPFFNKKKKVKGSYLQPDILRGPDTAARCVMYRFVIMKTAGTSIIREIRCVGKYHSLRSFSLVLDPYRDPFVVLCRSKR
jgi:hypothetical protein